MSTGNNIFVNGGQEYFEYEKLSLYKGQYIHNSYLDNYISDCEIDIDFTRNVISTINFTIDELSTINYFTDLLQPWYCLKVGSNTYKYPLGVYMLSNPDISTDGIYVSRKVGGNDLLYALEQDILISSTGYFKDANVISTIKTILDGVGTWVKYAIDDSTAILPNDISFEVGTSKLTIINELLKMVNYVPLFVTGNGVYKSQAWTNVPNITYTFEDNTESLYENSVSSSRDYGNICNRIIMIDNTLQESTTPLSIVLTLEDEGLFEHPFSYTNIGRYVSRVIDREAASQDFLENLAKKELRQALEVEEKISYNHAFVSSRSNDGLPWVNDGFRFKNSILNINAVYKLVSQNISLNTGVTISSTISKVWGVI
jgi:hypothetical protein